MTTIRSAVPKRAVILVIGGYLAAEQRPILVSALGDGALIVYNIRTLGREFVAAVGTAREQVVGVTPRAQSGAPLDEEFRLLREEINRVVRQQANTLHAMQELAIRTGDGLEAIERAVSALPVQHGEPYDTGQELPSELETLFGRAQRSLDGYGDIRRFVDETINVAARQPGERFARTHLLRDHDTFTRIGISAFLSDLLDGFRESVRIWFDSLSREPVHGSGVTPDESAMLRGICQTYDALYNVTPVHRIDPLPGMTSLLPENVSSILPSRSARRDALREAFDGLGDRVYQAAVDAAGDRRGSGV